MGRFIGRKADQRSDGVKSFGQHLLPPNLGKTTAVQQQPNNSPNGLVEPFALAVRSGVVGGGRSKRIPDSGKVSPRLLTDKRWAAIPVDAAGETKNAKYGWHTSNYSTRPHTFASKNKRKTRVLIYSKQKVGARSPHRTYKSRLRRSHGSNAFIRVWTGGLKKRGLISAQVRHDRHTVFVSSLE